MPPWGNRYTKYQKSISMIVCWGVKYICKDYHLWCKEGVLACLLPVLCRCIRFHHYHHCHLIITIIITAMYSLSAPYDHISNFNYFDRVLIQFLKLNIYNGKLTNHLWCRAFLHHFQSFIFFYIYVHMSIHSLHLYTPRKRINIFFCIIYFAEWNMKRQTSPENIEYKSIMWSLWKDNYDGIQST